MPTFLQLCQKVASESGTISGTFPTAVTGQTGRLGKIVQWTNSAWVQIQNAHSMWRWMQAEFYGNTVAGTQRYAYTAFNDFATSATITRFADWIYNEDTPDSGISLYDTAIGVSDEGPLRFEPWDGFYRNRLRGTQTQDKPALFTVTPDGKIALAKTPDASTYRVRGRYRKDVQELTADGDIPECPVRFHDAIVDIALIMLGTHDEAPAQIPLWRMRASMNFCNLERDQLPRMVMPGPLA